MNDTPPAAASQEVIDKLIAIVADFIEDFDEDFEDEITRNTRLLADLAFESIDIIQLVVAIEEDFGQRGMQFEELLMQDGRYVDDLSVGQIADFVVTKL